MTKFIFLIIITILPGHLLWAGSDTIAVFYPTALSLKERQKILKEEAKVDALVFSKFSEFNEYVKNNKPNLVIAPSSFKLSHENYTPTLRFNEFGHDDFKYLMLSLDQGWNAQTIGKARFGVVQELEQDSQKEYFSKILGVQIKTVKSVSKFEDLFLLLVFKSADVIVMSPYNFDMLSKQNPAKIAKALESQPSLPPILYVKEGANSKEEIAKFTALQEKTLQILGFSKVVPLQGTPSK